MSRASRMHDGEVFTRVVMTTLLIGAVVGVIALAQWAHPMLAQSAVEEAQERCQAINDDGEREEGELAQCMAQMAHIEATQRR